MGARVANITDVYNLALGHVGSMASVASPTEASVEAKACSRFYPMALDQALTDGHWSFATRREDAAPMPLPEAIRNWRFAYQHPGNALKVLGILTPGQQDERTQDFVIEATPAGAQILLTNTEFATVRYVERVADTSRFPPAFVNALAYLLAQFLCGPLRKDPAAAQALQQQYLMALSIAKGVDATGQAGEHNIRQRFTPPWIEARRGGINSQGCRNGS